MSQLEQMVEWPVVLVDTLEPDFTPLILPYGNKGRIKFRSDTSVFEKYREGHLEIKELYDALNSEFKQKREKTFTGMIKNALNDYFLGHICGPSTQECLETLKEWENDYNDWTQLRNNIETDFGERGTEIIFALREAVINYEEHRNKFDLTKEIYMWPWRSQAHLCFAINSTGEPNYEFNPREVRLNPIDPETGKLHIGNRGRGHIIMSSWANLLAYDEHGGMYLYFNLPEKNWIKQDK